MKIHELANKKYETFDDIVVDIAECIEEVNELEKERNDYKAESERLKNEVADLKERNLKLLSMMPVVPDVNSTIAQSSSETTGSTLIPVYPFKIWSEHGTCFPCCKEMQARRRGHFSFTASTRP